MNYAIIESGAKQYRVSINDVIDVELTPFEGNFISFDKVLLIRDEKGTKIGSPTLASTEVKAEVLGESKGPKTIAYKYKKRKNYRRKVGHRQKYLRVKITEIKAG